MADNKITVIFGAQITELIVEREPYAALFNWYAAEAARAGAEALA